MLERVEYQIYIILPNMWLETLCQKWQAPYWSPKPPHLYFSEGKKERESHRFGYSWTTLVTVKNPWVGKIPCRREWLPTPVFLPGEFHGQRGLEGYSPRGHKDWITEHTFHLGPVILQWREKGFRKMFCGPLPLSHRPPANAFCWVLLYHWMQLIMVNYSDPHPFFSFPQAYT